MDDPSCGDKTLDGYQKKKYVCKLLFIFLLGHDIDFGHMEAVNLLSSNKYTEKQIGYLFISVLVGASSDLLKLVIQAIKNDLASRNPIHVCLALQCVANIGDRDMAEALCVDIPKLLVSGDTIDSVKQSAALCLLRLLRTSSDLIPMGEWASRVIHLLNDQHMGVVTAAASLIEALVKKSPDEYKGCVSLAVSRLSRIVTSSYTDLQDYTYYFVPAPWLSVKLVRLLQYYPPPDDAAVKTRLAECLETILNKAQEPPKSKKVQHSNAKNAVLFEAINLIIHMDSDQNLLIRSCNQLGQFLQHRETNLRYLALESMCLLATSEFSHEAVKKHQETVINQLKTERDVSVRQRAVDLLYAMCDRSNAEEIVSEMLSYLETADYSIREEMVLKVAILAEKYAVDYTWYVDVILNLIRIAGDYVSEEVWYRVIQIVINRDDVQGYAAKTVFEALQAPACHENMVKVGGYILGEFGNLIAGDPRSSPLVQFQLLHSKFHLCSPGTRGLLLSAYIKFINLFPEIKPNIQDVLKHDNQVRNSDVELQQRSMEYLQLSTIASADVLATVLEEMPPFPEKESSILAKLKKKKPHSVNEQAGDGMKPGPPGPPLQAIVNNAETNNATSPTQAPGATMDLLGLSTPAPAPAPSAPAASNANTLLDLFDTPGPPVPSLTAPDELPTGPSSVNGLLQGEDVSKPPVPKPPATYRRPRKLSYEEAVKIMLMYPEHMHPFTCKNNGVLFENEMIQVGVKSEFRTNLGRLSVFFGNKTTTPLTHFRVSCPLPPALEDKFNIQVKPVESTIDGGAQQQCMINVECITEFTDYISLNFGYVYMGVEQSFNLFLPISINKFLEATEMDSSQFFQRWKQLGTDDQEAQVIFNAKYGMSKDFVKTKLLGFGMSVLENIDPNPENFVSAGIVHTKMMKIGCLLRLEPNKQANMYRLTVHSSQGSLSKQMCKLLEKQL